MTIRSARILRTVSLAVLTATGLAVWAGAPPAFAGGNWNEAGIAWKTPEQGLAEAKTANKPVCVVIYTDWCPHCTNYSKIFHDASVMEAAKGFVMIHVNKEKEAAFSGKYAPDGDYIPRTVFLKPDGTLMPEITEQREQYRYFYDEVDPASLLRSMKAVAGMKFGG